MTEPPQLPDATISLYLHAEALRRAFPAWSIAVQPWAGDRARIEAVNPHGGGLYALISTDPADLWRELRGLSAGPAPERSTSSAQTRAGADPHFRSMSVARENVSPAPSPVTGETHDLTRPDPAPRHRGGRP